MIVREATLDDMPALLALEQEIIAAERPFDSAIKAEKTQYYDLHDLIQNPRICLAVAEDNAEVIGSGYAKILPTKEAYRHEYYSYLGFMFVIPEYRGQGVNQQVLNFLINWSQEKGVNEFNLEVYFHNQAAIRAYEKAGFVPDVLAMKFTK